MGDSAKPSLEVEVQDAGSGAPAVTSDGVESLESIAGAVEVDLTRGDTPPAGEQEAPKPEETEKKEEPAEGELPDFDPENEEVVQAYDTKFYTAEGKLDAEALTAEFDANAAKGTEGLNEGTYQYLEKTLGLDRATIKNIEAGQVARRSGEQAAFFQTYGGQEAVTAAAAWAKANYTPAQIEAYEAARKQGGAAYADQMELLMARAGRAGAVGAKPAGRRGPPQRRASTPARDATAGAAVGGASAAADKFANEGEYMTAWRRALRDVDSARNSGDREKLRAAEAARNAVRVKMQRGFRG